MNLDNYQYEGQTTIFDFLPTQKEKKARIIKYLSLFSGIGAFEKALDRLEIAYELIGFSEIDKYATKSYCAIHGVDESVNLGDITKIDEKVLPKDIDLITYGFPCQDISNAGKMKGLFNEDGTQTRSGLFFEALRIIEETQPRVAIAENVKNLTSKKFAEQFQIVLSSLAEAGYNNYWQVLNSKDFGIPQNRERVFIVSIRKDIDTGCFRFPKGFPLELRLKDMLEEEIDERYYLSANAINGLIRANQRKHKPNWLDVEQVAPTIDTRVGALGHYSPYIIEGSKVLVNEATKQGYAEAFKGDSINFEQPNSKTRRGRVGHGVAQTLTTSPQQGVVINANASDAEGLRIRKLTPKECFRLQDFDDSDFAKAEAVNSNTQLYKQAGNSITVAVPYYIFKVLLDSNIL